MKMDRDLLPVERGTPPKSKRWLKSESKWKKCYRKQIRVFSMAECRKTQIRRIKIRTAMADYRRRSLAANPNRSPFDAIAPPSIAGLCGGVRPILIEDYRRDLTRLSKIALEKYNHDNKQVPNFEFHKLVKSTISCVSGPKYYITLQAKQPEASNSPTIFQTQVWKKLCGPPEVISCAIKTY